MIRKFAAVLVPLIAVFAIAQPAGAKVKTEVSVYPWPGKGALGFVESAKPRLCAKNRQLVVWKESDGKVTRIGRARAVKRAGGFQWSLRDRGAATGTIVVTAARTGGCGNARSKRETMPRAGEIAQCPSLESICHLQRTHIEDTLPPFGGYNDCKMWMPKRDYHSSCPSEVTGGPIPFCCWPTGLVNFTIDAGGGDLPRDLSISAGGNGKTSWYMKGRLPSSNSARYTVTEAELEFWKPGIKWFTPDAGAPGTAGGPIYFNIEPGAVRGFDIYIGGFLYRK